MMPPNGIQRTILVVDDNVDMRMILRLTLERVGWQIIEAETGLDAIEKARQYLPHVIIMDYNMPVMDGISACHQITTSDDLRHIPILIYTGAYSEAIYKQSFDAGAVDFMTKPILPQDLRQRVEDVYLKDHSS